MPTKLVDALQGCDQWTLPNIRVLLHLALTIPLGSCESERRFSQLTFLKTYRRSTMYADRPSGLALIKINRSRCEKILKSQSQLSKLVEEFGKLHPRRMKLPFVLGDND